MSEHTIDLYLTNAQFKKMDNQKPFQVSFQQLNGNKPADHHVQIYLDKKEHTKLQRNLRSKKGFRFGPQKILGHGLFDSGLSLLKKAASNKMVQGIAKQALNKGLQMAGNSNNGLIAGAANLAKGATGGKMKKGSIEAKEHMARIRGMRKTGDGFNFLKTMKKAFKNPVLKQIGQVALKTAVPMAMQIAKSNPYTAPLAMGTQAILQSQGVETGGKLTGRVKKITMPEMIAMSNVRMTHPIEGGSFAPLGR